MSVQLMWPREKTDFATSVSCLSPEQGHKEAEKGITKGIYSLYFAYGVLSPSPWQILVQRKAAQICA